MSGRRYTRHQRKTVHRRCRQVQILRHFGSVAPLDRAPFSEWTCRGANPPIGEKTLPQVAFFSPPGHSGEACPTAFQKGAKCSPCRLHRSSLFTRTSAALLCGPTVYRQYVLPSYRGTVSGLKTIYLAPHHLFVLLAVLFSHQTQAVVSATVMPPALAPTSCNGKNFCLPGRWIVLSLLPGNGSM